MRMFFVIVAILLALSSQHPIQSDDLESSTTVDVHQIVELTSVAIASVTDTISPPLEGSPPTEEADATIPLDKSSSNVDNDIASSKETPTDAAEDTTKTTIEITHIVPLFILNNPEQWTVEPETEHSTCGGIRKMPDGSTIQTNSDTSCELTSIIPNSELTTLPSAEENLLPADQPTPESNADIVQTNSEIITDKPVLTKDLRKEEDVDATGTDSVLTDSTMTTELSSTEQSTTESEDSKTPKPSVADPSTEKSDNIDATDSVALTIEPSATEQSKNISSTDALPTELSVTKVSTTDSNNSSSAETNKSSAKNLFNKPNSGKRPNKNKLSKQPAKEKPGKRPPKNKVTFKKPNKDGPTFKQQNVFQIPNRFTYHGSVWQSTHVG